MKIKATIIIMLIGLLFAFTPTVYASGTIEETDPNPPEATEYEPGEEESEEYHCALFGDPDDDGGKEKGDPDGDGLPSTANFLQGIFNFIRFLGPALAIIFSVIEFVKAAAAQDSDALSKATKKTGWRIGLAIGLFFIPTIIDVVFSWLGWYGTCGIG